LKNRGVLVQITQDHKEEIDNTICATVNDRQLVMLAKDFMAIMKPIAVALDRAQRNDTTISLAVEVWSKLELDFQQLNMNTNAVMKCFCKR
jgi:hypothetical protein